ncbi:MAG: hypothetical protein ACRD2B_12465 [Terriglobia bacterium]
MEHSRRDFIKIGSGALGAMAVPPDRAKASPERSAPAVILEPDTSGGSVSVNPTEGVAGEHGTWTVTYRIGRNGIREHGGIRVELPDSWHSGIRNSANLIQSSDPGEENYVRARCSRDGIKLRTWVENEPHGEPVSAGMLVKTPRQSLDGRLERYVYVIRIWVTEGALQEGDTLSVIYGDTSGGSKGMRAGIIRTHPEPILLAVDSDGTGIFRMHPEHPTLVCHAGPPVELMLSGPSMLVAGKQAELKLSVVDFNANPTPVDGVVELRLVMGKAQFPGRVRFQSNDGWMAVPFTPVEPGVVRIEALLSLRRGPTKRRLVPPVSNESGTVSATQGGFRAFGNPMKVLEREPKLKIYWGELHSHTHYSWDGVGDDNFRYARYVSALDFYAMTDHSSQSVGELTHGLGPHVWDEYNAQTDKYYELGEFVTIHAYEASFGAPYGHHNVFFRNKPGPLLAPGNVTLGELWKALTAGEALTIPHHTGKMPHPIYWYPHDPEIDRNIEIYSAHGLSEAYNPRGPLAFERIQWTDRAESVHGPQYVQDAWIEGLKLSTIASTDDHRAHPAQPNYGRAAVAATGLTREEIFDGLYHRRTYGTTGVKILLDFSINGEPMGGTIKVASSPRLSIEAHGTDDIEFVEVLRYSKSDGAFVVIHTLYPEGADFTWSQADADFKEDSIYYVRLRQVRLVRTRIAMAWSSPIWVKRE